MTKELLQRMLTLVATCAFIVFGSVAVFAQNSEEDFHKILRERVAFDEADFDALQQGQTIVKVLPVQDKREVAVSGLVKVQGTRGSFSTVIPGEHVPQEQPRRH